MEYAIARESLRRYQRQARNGANGTTGSAPCTAGYANVIWPNRRAIAPFRSRCTCSELGDVAIATNPCELFVDYGVQIEARSKAEQTFLIQLASGPWSGYLPTPRAVAGGSLTASPFNNYSATVIGNIVGPEGGQAWWTRPWRQSMRCGRVQQWTARVHLRPRSHFRRRHAKYAPKLTAAMPNSTIAEGSARR